MSARPYRRRLVRRVTYWTIRALALAGLLLCAAPAVVIALSLGF